MEEIELHVEPPFGVLPGKTFEVQPFLLEPGDRIIFLTDGMLERNAASLNVAAALADTADLHRLPRIAEWSGDPPFPRRGA